MSLKHLGADSKMPPLTKGKLRIYSMVFCPYAQRARLVAEHKNIPYETVNILLQPKPEWYPKDVNPAGAVPCLQFDDGRMINESLVVSEYLDAAYPENKLIPSDPYTNATHKLIVEAFNKLIPFYYKLALKSDLTVGAGFNEALEKFMLLLQDDFFGGKHAAFVDLMVWPWIERFDFIRAYRNVEFSPSFSEKLAKYMDDMKKLPACKKLLISADNHEKFYNSVINKQMECDHGI
jgi:glutathione S-transferase